MTAPTPGWYPDPGGAAPYRWWNGQAWTTATHDGTTAAAVVAGAQPGVPSATTTPAATASYSGTGGYPAGQFGVAQQPVGQAGAETPATAYGTKSPFDSQGNLQMATSHARTADTSTSYKQNQGSIYTFIITAVYLVITLSTGLAFLGIAPALAAWRAKDRGEPLAPLAIGAAVIAVVVGVTTFKHHY